MISSNNKTSSQYIKLQIQYGSDLYELLLSTNDKKIRVEHLLDEIERITKVPKCHQSIIHKGQRLDQKPDANLDDLYIFNNSKLILTGTQKQFHDKYCCPNHDHETTTPKSSISNSSEKQQQQQQQENNDNTLSVKQEESSNNIKSTPSSFTISKKQDITSYPTGFVPEPNKSYEYYTIPYKTDLATLFKTIPPSTLNAQ